MIDEDIKNIIKLDIDKTPISLKMYLVQQYLFDKKGVNVKLNQPSGQISHSATLMSGNLVTDGNLLDYFYFCSHKYYKNKFNVS